MTAKDIIEIIRACIRPYITISGWSVGLGLTVWLVMKFVDKDIAMMIIGPIVGAIIAAVNFWLGGRAAEKKLAEGKTPP